MAKNLEHFIKYFVDDGNFYSGEKKSNCKYKI